MTAVLVIWLVAVVLSLTLMLCAAENEWPFDRKDDE